MDMTKYVQDVFSLLWKSDILSQFSDVFLTYIWKYWYYPFLALITIGIINFLIFVLREKIIALIWGSKGSGKK